MNKSQIRELDGLLKAWIDYLKLPEQFDKPNDKWLDASETCSLLRFSEITFYRKCKSGELPYSKPSTMMVWLSDIARFVILKEFN